VTRIADDKVIGEPNLDRVAGARQEAGGKDVRLAGRRIAAGMIMGHEDGLRAHGNGRTQDIRRMKDQGVIDADGDEMESEQVTSGVERERDEAFLLRAVPGRGGDMLAPEVDNGIVGVEFGINMRAGT